MNKYEIAEVLKEIGFLIQIDDESPMKGLAYKKAAESLLTVENLDDLIQKNGLDDLPFIGKKIEKIILDLYHNKKIPFYQKLKKSIPQSLFELLQIPGLSLQKIRLLYESNIISLNDFKQALKKGKLKGFSPYFIRKLTERMEEIKTSGVKIPLYLVEKIAASFHPSNDYKILVSGEIRRKMELISKLDLVLITDDSKKAFSIVLQNTPIKKILYQGKNTLRFTNLLGLEIRLHAISQSKAAFTLFKTTGVAKHVKKIQKKAQRNHVNLLDKKSENAIYQALHIPYIEPELREDLGEIEIAEKGKLPKLIEERDLKGTFHCHTPYSDGTHTMAEMAKAAMEKSWEYLGISDHSKSSYQANGMSEETLIKQLEEIKHLNLTLSPFKIFSGIECDILKDGSLDFSNEVLAKLDFVIVSIHRYFQMEKKEMTKRLIQAIENPYTTMIGHLTGRLLRMRRGYDVDIDKVIDACVANHKVIEINAYPNRLDMDWRHWIKAKEKGLKCSINPDAHSIQELHYVRYGVYMARKGWLETQDVINTKTLREMTKFLKK